jgi:hypothetical protein
MNALKKKKIGEMRVDKITVWYTQQRIKGEQRKKLVE